MATYQILYWHDIPSQVRARDGFGRGRVSLPLPQRFQDAIDSAAMLARQIDSGDYMAGYMWSEIQERPGAAQDVAEAVVAELDRQYPDIDWRSTAAHLRRGV